MKSCNALEYCVYIATRQKKFNTSTRRIFCLREREKETCRLFLFQKNSFYYWLLWFIYQFYFCSCSINSYNLIRCVLIFIHLYNCVTIGYLLLWLRIFYLMFLTFILWHFLFLCIFLLLTVMWPNIRRCS